MASETNWICDWCGERVENVDRYPKEWATIIPQQATARSSMGDKIERRGGQLSEVHLFPKEMFVEKTDEHPAHFETELCGGCFKAILDALKNVRELRISKRQKK